MNDYNLIYWEKDTGKKFLGRRISAAEYRIKDPETGLVEHTTHHYINKRFKSDKSNLSQRKLNAIRVRRYKAGVKNSKAFKAYMEGVA